MASASSHTDGKCYLVLFTRDGWEDRIGTFFNFTFNTNDIDAAYAEFRAKGVETMGPPRKEEWGNSPFFLDADGNKLLIAEE